MGVSKRDVLGRLTKAELVAWARALGCRRAAAARLANEFGDPDHDSDIGRIVYVFRERYVKPMPEWRAEAQEDEGVPFGEKYPRLLEELEGCFPEGKRLTAVVREALGRMNHAG